jgi:hypothetical protein
VREACEGFRRRVLLMTAGMHVGAPPMLPPGAPTVALPIAEYPEHPEHPESAPFGARALEGEPATAAPPHAEKEGADGTISTGTAIGTGFQPHLLGRGGREETISERLPGMAGWLVAEPTEHWGSRWTISRHSRVFRPCPWDGATWCEMRGSMVWHGVWCTVQGGGASEAMCVVRWRTVQGGGASETMCVVRWRTGGTMAHGWYYVARVGMEVCGRWDIAAA